METYVILCYMLELAVIVPSAIMALLPVRDMLRMQPGFVYGAAAATLAAYVALGGLVCTYLHIPSVWLQLPGAALLFVPYSLSVDASPGKKLFCFFNAAMINAFASVYTSFLAAPLEVNNDQLTFLPQSSLICLGVCAVLLALFAKTLTQELPLLMSKKGLDPFWSWWAVAPVILVAILVWSNPASSAVILTGRVRIVSLVLLGLFPIATYLLYHMFWQVATQLTTNAELRQKNDLLSLEEKRFDMLRTYLYETRAMRNGYLRSLLTLDEMARANNRDAVLAYLDELIQAVRKDDYTQLCPNGAVDAIAARFSDLAAAQNTRIIWSLDLPQTLPVKETDLCSILGNLMENALQAVAQLPEQRREVRVSTQLVSPIMLAIKVSNPYDGIIQLDESGLPRSTAEGRGVGLTSVATVVQAHGGTMSIDVDDGVFLVGIILNARPQQAYGA